MTQLAEIVRGAVLRAAREHALLHSPGCVHELVPPCAVADEERIISAVLFSSLPLSALAPLRSRDFFVPLHGGVVTVLETFATTGRETTLEGIALGLDALGFIGPVHDDLVALRDGVPHTVNLTEHVGRVLETSRRRRLLAWLRQLEMRVTTGALSADEAAAEIRRACTSRSP